MESRRQLDVVSRARACRTSILAIVLPICLCAVRLASAQTPLAVETARIRALFEAQMWSEIVQAVGGPSAESADLNYYYGMAAAQLGEWERARAAFRAGMRLAPSDPRFPTE